MKKRYGPEQIVAKLRQADVELGKGLKVPEELYKKVASGRGRETKTFPNVPGMTERHGQLQNNCKTGSDTDGGDDAQVLVNTESGRRDSNPQHSAWKTNRWPSSIGTETFVCQYLTS